MLLAAANLLAPQSEGQMAVAFSPFTSEESWSIVRVAVGYAVGPTRFPKVVVVYAVDANFQQRARNLGALFS